MISKFILIGEDDVDDQEILEEIFTDEDKSLTVRFINNGKQFLFYLEKLPAKHLPCLIVLDYNMPGLNGAEILKKISEDDRFKNIPVVVWSTSGADTYRNQSLQSGATDYLVKPSDIKSLKQSVQHMLSLCKSDAM